MTTQQSAPNLKDYHWTKDGYFKITVYNDAKPVPVTSVSRWVESSSGWKHTVHDIEETACSCGRNNCLHKRAVKELGDRVVQHHAEKEPIEEPKPSPLKPEVTLPIATDHLSAYQRNILKAIYERLNSQGPLKGLLVEALAGCGKSFTISQVVKLLNAYGITPDQARIVVFGKKNKLDLSEKVARVGEGWGQSVRTLHSLSFQILKEVIPAAGGNQNKPDSFKYHKIAQKMKLVSYWENGVLNQGSLTKGGDDAFVETDSDFMDLVEKIRLYFYEPNPRSIEWLTKKHNIGVNLDRVLELTDWLVRVLDEGVRLAYTGKIDYTDMSWIVARDQENFSGAIASMRKQLRFVALDEAQDTDNLQLTILGLIIDPERCFLMAVGDRYQAVYGFRGCLSDGLDKIAEQFNCESLPLPINYRCGVSHLDFVRELFPHIGILPHDKASQGVIRFVRAANLLSVFTDKAGDYLGICRKNAPLIRTAIWLLSQGLPVKIKDKSLGDKLVALVKKIDSKFDPETFPEKVDAYLDRERERVKKYPNAAQLMDDAMDRVGAIMALFEVYYPKTLKDWKTVVDRIFTESEYTSAINLYSIHSGKGGEGKDVIILNPQSMPLIYKGMTRSQRNQEDNLLYVALTRAIECLTVVIEKDAADNDIWPSWVPERMRVFS